ncbi:hypothetical protein GU927_016010 [Rhodobacteraceae bacterium HSP-20]|uniref:Uncharacterized protein n=1 Tax=Paragemmobacter amnigenus TaxID=2852097 RepID=A0ABS6J6G5_9RHOB|nr:hypothetical protein [Rhodobacter amnigenus]MBU9699351.1 hypothetical protein [Rhodobacter amnigenus]MBV4390578.1 hypothetical protein [Rhodobacter amnigenus]
MLRLNLAREAVWLDLALGVRVKVEPLTTAIMVAARTDPAVRAIAPGTPDDSIAVIFAKAIAARAIVDWEGVGDADGTPIPVSPEAIDALLDLWPIFEKFQTAYVAKGLELEAEKNVSAPLLTGSSVGATDTAKPAKGAARTARKS